MIGHGYGTKHALNFSIAPMRGLEVAARERRSAPGGVDADLDGAVLELGLAATMTSMYGSAIHDEVVDVLGVIGERARAAGGLGRADASTPVAATTYVFGTVSVTS